jgi:hypothetical protein
MGVFLSPVIAGLVVCLVDPEKPLVLRTSR